MRPAWKFSCMPININGLVSSSNLRNLDQATKGLKKSFEKLSSGKRINSASDDPAGLAVAQSLLVGADTSAVAARNVSDGLSVANIVDGALTTTGDIVSRLSELATQASNGTLGSDQRAAVNSEFQALKSELDRISSTTEFNGQQLLSGSGNSIGLQVGTDSSSSSQITLNTVGVSASSLGLAGTDLSSQASAQAALDATKNAVANVTQARGEVGSVVSRLDTAFNNLKVSEENLRSSASSIRDLDVAQEAANLTAFKIRQQANVALGAQEKQSAVNVLKLLS